MCSRCLSKLAVFSGPCSFYLHPLATLNLADLSYKQSPLDTKVIAMSRFHDKYLSALIKFEEPQWDFGQCLHKMSFHSLGSVIGDSRESLRPHHLL